MLISSPDWGGYFEDCSVRMQAQKLPSFYCNSSDCSKSSSGISVLMFGFRTPVVQVTGIMEDDIQLPFATIQLMLFLFFTLDFEKLTINRRFNDNIFI